MENVQQYDALPPAQSVPTSRPRSRRMGAFIESPFLPPSPPMDKLDTPPESPKSDCPRPLSPSRTSSLPPPVLPPRSPLRPPRCSTKSTGSFRTIMEYYTKRDTMQTLRPKSVEREEDTVHDPSSWLALLHQLNSGSPDTSIDEASVIEGRLEKPLPQPPTDSPPTSPIMTASSSGETADSNRMSVAPSESTLATSSALGSLSFVHDVDISETSTLASCTTGTTKREHALKEILSSEQAYASDLAFIKNVHIALARGKSPTIHARPPTPPSSSGSSTRTNSTASDSSSVSRILGLPMTDVDVRIIFNNIEQIAHFSGEFVDLLKTALGDVLDEGEGEDRVGAAFLHVLPYMEDMYTKYITKQHKAVEHFNTLPKTAALGNYLTQTQLLAKSITHSWDLPSLLIKPVQRLLKYPLLLAAVIEQTPKDHSDLPKLIEARKAIEKIAHRINDNRRRFEVVKGVLQGKSDSALAMLQKKKHGVAGNPSLMRMKSIGPSARGPRDVEADNKETKHVKDCERRLKETDAFIRGLAEGVASWVGCVKLTQEHLRAWALDFGRTIGLSEECPSDAFNAFLDLIERRLLPICVDLDTVTRKEIVPTLARLVDTSKSPKKVLDKMHSYKNQHTDLLNMSFSSKLRPTTTLMEASQSYLDLRAQLSAELPAYIDLLEKGVIACIMRFAGIQRDFWSYMRDAWATLWDCLRMEGETNVGCEETFRLWWMRYSEAEESIRGLHILKPIPKSQQIRTQSSDVASLPGSDPSMELPSGRLSPPDPDFPHYRRHRSFGSMDRTAQHPLQRAPSMETFQQACSPTRSRSQPRSPDSSGRSRKGRSNTSPFPTSSSSPTLADYINTHSISEPKQYTESIRSSTDIRGRQSRSSSFSQMLSDSLRAPLRKTSSQKSLGSVRSNGTREFYAEPEPMPCFTLRELVDPDTPAEHTVKVIHDFVPSKAVRVDPPFFQLSKGYEYDLLCNLGPCSKYPWLMMRSRDSEKDDLLILRDEFGHLGLGLSGYVLPEDFYYEEY